MKPDVTYSMSPEIKEALKHLKIQVSKEQPMFGSDAIHLHVSLFLDDEKISSDYETI